LYPNEIASDNNLASKHINTLANQPIDDINDIILIQSALKEITKNYDQISINTAVCSNFFIN
jgi:hypothetical protein